MTCEEFRQIASVFSLEMPHAVALMIFTHMDQCPHCEEYNASLACHASSLTPQDIADCEAYGNELMEEFSGPLTEGERS